MEDLESDLQAELAKLVRRDGERSPDDTYRRHIVQQNLEDVLLVAQIKQKCEELRDMINVVNHDPRARAVALTKLEEVAMWATKAATK